MRLKLNLKILTFTRQFEETPLFPISPIRNFRLEEATSESPRSTISQEGPEESVKIDLPSVTSFDKEKLRLGCRIIVLSILIGIILMLITLAINLTKCETKDAEIDVLRAENDQLAEKMKTMTAELGKCEQRLSRIHEVTGISFVDY